MDNNQKVTVRMWEENLPEDCEGKLDGHCETFDAPLTLAQVVAFLAARGWTGLESADLEDLGRGLWELSDNGFSLMTFHELRR